MTSTVQTSPLGSRYISAKLDKTMTIIETIVAAGIAVLLLLVGFIGGVGVMFLSEHDICKACGERGRGRHINQWNSQRNEILSRSFLCDNCLDKYFCDGSVLNALPSVTPINERIPTA
jgi:hypothetical protein